jgi:hypothetical protein
MPRRISAPEKLAFELIANARKNLEAQVSRLRGLEKGLAEAKTDEERKPLREDLRQQDGNLRRARDRVRYADMAFDRLC